MNEGQEQPKRRRIALLWGIVGIVAAVSAVLTLLLSRESAETVVEIESGGEVLYTLDLRETPDTRLNIPASNGSYNIVCVEDGEIFVSEAGCPDKTCVRMGPLRADAMPIVCLPNRLVVRFQKGD